ncbi:MAG: polysaccharide biosynthesis/export family protein [Gemmataceae bacterium]
MTERISPKRVATSAALLLVGLLNGCAAVSNPVVDGIPVRRLPPEALGQSRETERPISLASLRQPPPEFYRLGPGDVLGVHVEGVLGEKNAPPPVRIPEQGNVPPALGYPLPVREDGTVPLPLIDPVKVEGLSLSEAQAKVVKAYTVTKVILKPGRDRIIVTLIKPRTYQVLVLREDAGDSTVGTTGGFGGGFAGGGASFQQTRRTAGFALDLPAYENDVLNALTRSGGLPGAEAENEVIVERRANRPKDARAGASPEDLMRRVEGKGERTLRIPLRVRPDQPLELRPEDIILETGDVVLVKARRGEVFYTAGLLPSRSFPLPRDRDLDIVQALALVGAPIVNGGFNANNLSGSLVQSGLGFPSPSQVTVLRQTANRGQLPITVNLNRALRDPRERILVQPGDIVLLQQSVDEAMAQYLTTNFRFNFFSTFIRQRDLTATGTVNLP